jgi:hypothetical protein
LKVNVIVVGINLLKNLWAYLVGCESFYRNPTDNLLSLVSNVLDIFVGQDEIFPEVNFGI